MYLGHQGKGVFSTVFNEIIEEELNVVEKRMEIFKRNLRNPTEDREIDEVKRIVYSAVLSHLRTEYGELKKYGLTIGMLKVSESSESVGFTET
ncbi:MAG: hypothetical protein F7B60_04730 [Desulfurococcales archaeon]|nr:hypothetical protein [Desulfurococcales archaeon]